MKTLAEIKAHARVTIIEASEHGGAALVKRTMGAKPLRVIFAWGLGWDHVSVSLQDRVPNYHEMKHVKRIFFRPDEWAVEYHPPQYEYISVNDNVLHLWRPQDGSLPTPPSIMV
jgi:hypothetical protein